MSKTLYLRTGPLIDGVRSKEPYNFPELDDVELFIEKKPLYEYRDIWAEESSSCTSGSAEWSFGNGATGYMGLPIDKGWEVIGLGFHADTFSSGASITVDLMDYSGVASNAASNTISSISLINEKDGGGSKDNAYKYVNIKPVDVSLDKDTVLLGFITRNLKGSISDARVYARLRRKIGEYVSEVSLS